MYELWWRADTGAFVVQAALEEAGLPYRLIPVERDGSRTPEFLALNPMGQIPILRLPDGTLLTETGAMLLAIADAAPASDLMPAVGTTARAVAYRWLFWAATALYETDLRYYYPDRYTSDPAGADAVRETAHNRLDELMAMADRILAEGPLVPGADATALDLYLLMLTVWHPDQLAVLDRWPNLAARIGKVRQRPSVQRIWAQHYPSPETSPWSTWTGSSAS
jgi:glutathione S-transferase